MSQILAPAFASLADLASSRVGGRAVATNDDFFASKANLVKPEPAIFIPGKFTSRGKWMDGWESRRRRTPGHDWCIVKLGMRGVIRGVNVETSHFTGNYPSHCSIDAMDAKQPWIELLPQSALRGNAANFFAIQDERPWTHVRLNIFPDGGVARLRVYGEVLVDWRKLARGRAALDLASIRNGGLVLEASDMHFGAKDNMIMPGRAENMGDGWETKRRRGPGYDWAIVRLGAPGLIAKIEIDTNHFKGNYPESASVEASSPGGRGFSPADEWTEILPRVKLGPHRRHFFSKELRKTGPVSRVRLNIYPDGGISRFRVYGTVAAD
jgi:allantoicase